ncbi:MAG: hypothetical protein ACRD1R_08170, partial [Acidobacteriota bacterium]
IQPAGYDDAYSFNNLRYSGSALKTYTERGDTILYDHHGGTPPSVLRYNITSSRRIKRLTVFYQIYNSGAFSLAINSNQGVLRLAEAKPGQVEESIVLVEPPTKDLDLAFTFYGKPEKGWTRFSRWAYVLEFPGNS